MRIYTRFQVLKKAKSNSGLGYLLLALAALAFLGWIWWHSAKSVEHAKATPQTNDTVVAHSTPATTPAKPVVVPPPAKTTTIPVVVPPAPVATNPVTPPRVAVTPAPIPTTPEVVNGFHARPVQNVFEAQLALEHVGISSGSFDGSIGSQTRAALRAYQDSVHLPVTGELDAATKSTLLLTAAPMTTYEVTTNDLARLQPLGKTWIAKSQQTALDFETVLELVAEKAHSHPGFIQRLNPSVNWTNVVAGTVLNVPNASLPSAHKRAAYAKISLSGKVLEAFDENDSLLLHFPCSIAQRVEKRPVGELKVSVIAPNPNYTFNPEVFPESEEAKQINHKLILKPGPNNPVGVAWIGLDRPGYGMHGTPSPEQVGRTESHGCFRLANWNAEYLVKIVWIGMPVKVEP